MPVIDFVNTFLGICPASLVDHAVFSLIDRYSYCKRYPSVPPFSGGYDEQPKEWQWIVNIIEDELSLLHGRES